MSKETHLHGQIDPLFYTQKRPTDTDQPDEGETALIVRNIVQLVHCNDELERACVCVVYERERARAHERASERASERERESE